MKENKRRYSVKSLYCDNKQRTYKSNASQAAFLLGGIGTGNVSIGARGELKSWQIFNEPGQNNYLPYTFFAIRAQSGKNVEARVLEAQIEPPYAKSQGFLRGELAGLPRFDSAEMSSEYPFVQIQFEDESFPAIVSLEAFTPFIPLNADDSGIPGIYFTYKVKNPTSESIHVSIAGTIDNPIGFDKYDNFSLVKHAGKCINEYIKDPDYRGILFYGEEIPEKHIANGTMALLTTNENTTVKPTWVQGEWTDGAEDFWDDFIRDGRLNFEGKQPPLGCEWAKKSDYAFLHFSDSVGSLCIEEEIPPEETKEFNFILTWSFPYRPSIWADLDKHKKAINEGTCPVIKNYYAIKFPDAVSAGQYMIHEQERLYTLSRKFSDAFYSTTLPGYVLEAAANNITVLRSPTCFRIENGSFLGWEGVENDLGCGAGNCSHVWNYAQTVAFLFPELEQSMRRIEFVDELQEDGYIPFRAYSPLERETWKMAPSADGQLGAVIRLYREWKISGNDELLKDCWRGVVLTMKYAENVWDSDGDGVLDLPQHVTYDTELYGITSMVSTIYLGALIAVSEMAKHLGENELAKACLDMFESASNKLDLVCFDGEYYRQSIENIDLYRYQYGDGCLSDQLLGQFIAKCAGIGDLLPHTHIRSAIKSVYDYNFVDCAKENVHLERGYILNHEKGLTPCTWPKGGRPLFPFVYYGEVWTGIEYEVAALLIEYGWLEEGLTVLKTVRDRHDGYKRNPWSDNESGYYYTRAMASYGAFLALCGYRCDLVKGTISFAPKMNRRDFSAFWSTGTAWGIYTQKIDRSGNVDRNIEVLYGDAGSIRLD